MSQDVTLLEEISNQDLSQVAGGTFGSVESVLTTLGQLKPNPMANRCITCVCR